LKFLIIFLFCIGVYFANDVTKIFPFHIISVFLFFPFFVVGIILKKHYLTFKNKIRSWYFIPFLIMGLIFMNLNKLTPDLRVNIIGNPFVFYLSSFLLIFALLLLSCIVYKEKITEWLGINSLLIMCLHLKFLFLAQWICLKISIDNGFIVSLFLCVILYFPVVFIKKYLPILEGN
jgi:fucose 4-O-acetylase-like acetyltransferase